MTGGLGPLGSASCLHKQAVEGGVLPGLEVGLWLGVVGVWEEGKATVETSVMAENESMAPGCR